MGRVLFGGVIGALIAFVCSFISWVVLPWHEWTLQPFANQELVSSVISENVQKDGVYVIAYPERGQGMPSSTSDEAHIGEEAEASQNRPLVYAQVKKGGLDHRSSKEHIISFLTQFIGATLVGIILTNTKKSSYGVRLLVVTVVSLVVGVLGYIPHWNRFGGGHGLLIVNMADLVITWFLAGLVMAAVVRPKPEQHIQAVPQPACQ